LVGAWQKKCEKHFEGKKEKARGKGGIRRTSVDANVKEREKNRSNGRGKQEA